MNNQNNFINEDLILKDYQTYLISSKNFSTNTVEAYIGDIEKFKSYLKNEWNVSLIEANKSNIEAYISELKLKKIKSTSLNRFISSIKSFYNFLLKKGLIKNNPSILIKTLKKEKRLPSFFTYNEIISFINYLNDIYKKSNDFIDLRNLLIVELLAGSGLRVSELINVRFKDISLKNKVVKVKGKGSKERFVPISDSFMKIFQNYNQKYDDFKKKLVYSKDKEIFKQNEYIFINKRGKKLSRGSIFYILKNLFKKYNVLNKDIFPHKFRHTFATLLLKNGADIRFVQKLLGHSSLASTEVYTHLDIERKKEMYKNFHPHA